MISSIINNLQIYCCKNVYTFFFKPNTELIQELLEIKLKTSKSFKRLDIEQICFVDVTQIIYTMLHSLQNGALNLLDVLTILTCCQVFSICCIAFCMLPSNPQRCIYFYRCYIVSSIYYIVFSIVAQKSLVVHYSVDDIVFSMCCCIAFCIESHLCL